MKNQFLQIVKIRSSKTQKITIPQKFSTTQYSRAIFVGVDDWWNRRVQSNVKLPLETANALKAVFILEEKLLLCICITKGFLYRGCCLWRGGGGGGEAVVEGDEFHISAGRETKDRWPSRVHHMKGVRLGVAVV